MVARRQIENRRAKAIERNRVVRVVAAVMEQNGRVLICQRRSGGVFGLQWEFPGGKMRKSETPRAALIRELREELGIETRIGPEIYRARYRYSQLPQTLQLLFFSASTLAGSAAPRNLAFERIVWARRPELASYDFLLADRPLVARLMRGEIPARGGK
jgi:8-oxo-dGTP diphosphatase